MNILIYVMTILMLLSLMTYARLQSFRSSQAFQVVFKHYMEENERGHFNSGAESVYQGIEIPSKPSEKGPKGPKIEGSPRIGLALLVDSDREAKGKEWEQTKVLFKNLAQVLYQQQPFYQEMEKTRPSFLDELIREITHSIDELPVKDRPKKAVRFGNLKLRDPELDAAFYKMLHGALYTQYFTSQEKEPLAGKPLQEANSEESEDEEEETTESGDEYRSPEGYYSLLDFIKADSKPVVRVYLAPKEVLEAIFRDPALVQTIMDERQRLHRQAKSGADALQLTESFKNQFVKMRDPAIDEESLNFAVTKTNPKYYK